MAPAEDPLAAQEPVLATLFYVVAGLYGASFLASAIRPSLGRWLLIPGALTHLAATIGRGVVIEFFPLTGKMESFSAAALALAAVAATAWHLRRAYLLPLLAVLCVTFAAALSFPLDLAWPPPLMRTLWYPLHVPLSFLAYGLWVAAAAAALAWFVDSDPAWLARIDRFALGGFGLWSVSMVMGGLWGVAAWGAYFLWDPKVVWSVILWFHYATFVHLRLVPSLQARLWVRPVLALVGLLFVFVAYVGTSFLFGRSSHAF